MTIIFKIKNFIVKVYISTMFIFTFYFVTLLLGLVLVLVLLLNTFSVFLEILLKIPISFG